MLGGMPRDSFLFFFGLREGFYDISCTRYVGYLLVFIPYIAIIILFSQLMDLRVGLNISRYKTLDWKIFVPKYCRPEQRAI